MTTTESYGCDKHGEDAYQGCAMCDLETLRERLHEAELVAASWKREAELNEQAANESSGYAKRLAEAEAYGKAQQRWAHEWRDKHDALTAENAALREERALIIQRAESAEAAFEGSCDMNKMILERLAAADALLAEVQSKVFIGCDLVARIDAHLARKP